eukprot:CAMPEP_0171299858 /NCGR_PEP_ID=MMETSP0816-20121228/8728_1 /TAXON_ID=420281 /ORGANISM="Proboscia inermis, Strain CCAP1064/1" /LENGTH=61 /DNA_ID=CAMNT_0011776011 /DNA_START=767 /DNA_END=952 /DNA_ORIENTATION=-
MVDMVCVVSGDLIVTRRNGTKKEARPTMKKRKRTDDTRRKGWGCGRERGKVGKISFISGKQ